MRKGGTCYRTFLAALWTTLILGALITQAPPSLKQTFLFLISLGLAFLAQSWLFGTRYFGDSAEVVAGVVKEEAIYFAGDLVDPNERAAREDRMFDEVLSSYRQIGIRAGFAAVAAPYVLGVAWGHVSLSVAGSLQIVVALLIVPAMSLNHLMLPLAASVLAVFLQLKSEGFASPVLPVLYLTALSGTLVFYRFLELELCRTSVVPLDDRKLNRRGLWAAGQSAAVLLGTILLANAVIPDATDDTSMLAKLAAQLNKLSELFARKIPERLRLTESPSKTSPQARHAAVAGKMPPKSGNGAAPVKGNAPQAALPGTGSGDGKLPNLSLPNPGQSNAAAENPPDLEAMPQGGRFTENGELRVASGAQPTEADRQHALALAKGLANNTTAAAGNSQSIPMTEPERRQGLELAKKLADNPAASGELPLPSQAQLAALEKLAKEPSVPDKAASAQITTPEVEKKSSKEPPSSASSSPSSSPSQQAATAAATSGTDQGAGAPAAKQDAAASSAGPDSAPNEEGAPLEQPAPGNDKAPAPSPPSPPLITEAALRRGMVFLLLAVAVWFASMLSHKAMSKRASSRPRLSRAKRKEVLTELAELNQMRISPREEVILRYQFFLKLMAVAQFPKEEYLPATDYHHRLKASYPAFAKQSETITVTFCNTFYGENDVTTDQVKSYRKSLEVVLRHFGC